MKINKNGFEINENDWAALIVIMFFVMLAIISG